MMQLWLALLTLLEDFQHIADVLAQDEQVKKHETILLPYLGTVFSAALPG